ncbi:hypothetical protein P5G50_08920 [Leifsonia sp. F6_8S_P_1B]|uniref:Uncharacterized protein n=1 Tax=Leifsonia williamsii TaxID=3035919 RepID=A0ABT8KAU4_9MICO|nr:hypothetical protein [Leifsonia williamsii]MDN4614573.1 hypothetical protein [Leifsonia williamsii]
MNLLYPRLPRSAAERLYETAEDLSAATEHSAQIFAPVGGRRATPTDVAKVSDAVRAEATACGFPASLEPAKRIEFDRRVARVLVEVMDLSWSEAAATEIWSFLALVALPDVTRWRFGTGNPERWIASDLTRHIWARAWWRGTVFQQRPDLLDVLSESDLNQVLERRVIGGDPRLVIGIADALVRTNAQLPGHRRDLIRNAAARLRRRLAFIDARALDDTGVTWLCQEMLNESAAWVVEAPQELGEEDVA